MSSATAASAGNATAVGRASPPLDATEVRALFDKTVPAQLKAHRIPGAAVVVVNAQHQVFAGGYGVADAATGRPVVPDRTVFPIDSVTKLVTATAVMQLVEQGAVDLHTDVNRYLDGFEIDTRHPVTLEHLLTHTAGFEEQVIGTLPADPDDVRPLASEIAADQPAQVRPPGTYAGYSNYGMALAGLVVEQRGGLAFDEYVAQHILQPLGMAHTGFHRRCRQRCGSTWRCGTALREEGRSRYPRSATGNRPRAASCPPPETWAGSCAPTSPTVASTALASSTRRLRPACGDATSRTTAGCPVWPWVSRKASLQARDC